MVHPPLQLLSLLIVLTSSLFLQFFEDELIQEEHVTIQ